MSNSIRAARSVSAGFEWQQASTERKPNPCEALIENSRMNESVATPGMTTMKTQLRRILSESARLDVSVETLSDSDDLYAAGLSSLATVHVMLAIEDEFAIEIPDRMLTRRLFSSIDTLAASIVELRRLQAAA
jgi:acyl carrier protein